MNERTEPCSQCDRETTHAVKVKLKAGKSVHGRTPVREATCTECGTSTELDMGH